MTPKSDPLVNARLMSVMARMASENHPGRLRLAVRGAIAVSAGLVIGLLLGQVFPG